MEISNIKIAAYVAFINLLQMIWQKCLFYNWLLSLLSRKKYNLRVELWSANARNLRKNVFVDFIFFRRNISRISWKGAFVLYCNENISKFFLIIFFNKPLNISKVSWNTYISSGTVKHKVSGSFSLRTILFCNRFFYSLFCTNLYIQNFVFRIRTVWGFFC